MLILAVLYAVALWLRFRVAAESAPSLGFAIGPDADDWDGVFRGASAGFPVQWDGEWAYKYPLLPLLTLWLSRTAKVSMWSAAQFVCVSAGAATPMLTYLLGRRILPPALAAAALAAGGWVLVQDGLLSHSILTTAYALVPPLYLSYLLALLWHHDRGGLPRAIPVVLASWAFGLTLLHGSVMLLLTAGAGLLSLLLAGPGPARRQWVGMLWPTFLGLLLTWLVLRVLPGPFETPWGSAWRHIYEEYRQTVFHDSRFGVPTGHQVDRLLAGTSRLVHLALSTWEYFNLPLLVMAPALVGGIVLLLRHGRGRFGSFLVLLLLPGVIYGFAANSEDFHVFQWFPVLILLCSLGLVGWPILFRKGRGSVVLGQLLGLSLLFYQCWLVPLRQELDPARRYSRVRASYDDAMTMSGIAASVGGPVSRGGTLLVDSPQLWAHRALIPGNGRLLAVSGGPGSESLVFEPRALTPPVYLLTFADAEHLGRFFSSPIQALYVTEFAPPHPWKLYGIVAVDAENP